MDNIIEATNIVECARCGNDHEKMTFKKLKNASGKNTHWAMCPDVDEPILMYAE
jgi:hypothetical protein